MVSPREAKESAHTLNNARKSANGRHRKGGPLDENTAAQSLQDLVRGRIISDYRLHRSNLAERLKFESSVVWESLRFLNQLLVFALFLGALRLSSNEVQKRGIFENLKEVFDFETLIAIKTRQQFVDEALYPISEASREYFLLSTRYFGDNGAGSRQIIRDVASFDAPFSVGQLPLGTSQFSFTAWVQTSPGFVEGYIVQKPLGVTGLSCWGWHLHSSLGPSLHYGGHDSYPQDPSFPPQAMAERQIRVSPAQSPSFSTGNFAMLTLAVSASKVEFFHNAELLSTVPLTTRITDCLSERGVLAGAAQMKIADLRFHPKALTRNSIEELLFNGGSLGDFATGSMPESLQISEIAELQGKLASSISSVDERQSELKLSTDISFVTRFSDKPLDFHSPPAPTGIIHAHPDPISDPKLNREYHSLYLGPGRLTQTALDTDHRYIVNHPNFTGTGMTLSLWFRSRVCSDPTDVCGLFLFTAYEDGPRSPACWSLWLEKGKLWYDNPRGTLFGNPIAQYPDFGVPDRFKLADGRAWRHLTMVLDETTDQVLFYMDGSFVVAETWGSPVAEAACPSSNPRISFGRKAPGYTYGGEVEVFDLRMYVHGDRGPLSAADIANLSRTATPALDPKYKCVESSDPALEEREWRDVDGNDCSWYQAHVRRYPNICNAQDAAENCPISCSSRQECWDGQSLRGQNAYYSWNGIKRIETGLTSPMGSLCINDETSLDKVVRECEEWSKSGVPQSVLSSDWFQSFRTDTGAESRRGNRIDLRECANVARAVQQDCAINASAVRAFTKESQANNGDFTLFWWMQPLGKASLNAFSNTLIPHLQFLSSVSPPTHNLAVGLWANPNGEARFFSACPEEKFDNIELESGSSDGWTFFAITRRSVRDSAVGEGATLTNVGKNWEGSDWTKKQCLFNEDLFFAALEVNYPALMSPLTMIPAYMPISTLQREFQGLLKEVSAKIGSLSTNAESLEVEKAIFKQPMILITPPIIFQTRSLPAAECPSGFTKSLVQTHFDEMLRSTCAPPFSCAQDLSQSASQLLACAGDPVELQTQFGLDPHTFRGEVGYIDFLSSLGSPFLLRDGMMFETKDFLDTLTRTVQVYLVFWNPEASITTVLRVTADFSSAAAAEIDVSVEHYELLEGPALLGYIVVQSIVLVNVLLMFVDIFINTKNTLGKVMSARALPLAEGNEKGSKRKKQSVGTATFVLSILHGLLISASALFKDVVDAIIATLVVTYVAMRIPSRRASREETEGTVGELSRIEWASTEVVRSNKVEAFIRSMDRLIGTLSSESFFNQACRPASITERLAESWWPSLRFRVQGSGLGSPGWWSELSVGGWRLRADGTDGCGLRVELRSGGVRVRTRFVGLACVPALRQ